MSRGVINNTVMGAQKLSILHVWPMSHVMAGFSTPHLQHLPLMILIAHGSPRLEVYKLLWSWSIAGGLHVSASQLYSTVGTWCPLFSMTFARYSPFLIIPDYKCLPSRILIFWPADKGRHRRSTTQLPVNYDGIWSEDHCTLQIRKPIIPATILAHIFQ